MIAAKSTVWSAEPTDDGRCSKRLGARQVQAAREDVERETIPWLNVTASGSAKQCEGFPLTAIQRQKCLALRARTFGGSTSSSTLKDPISLGRDVFVGLMTAFNCVVASVARATSASTTQLCCVLCRSGVPTVPRRVQDLEHTPMRWQYRSSRTMHGQRLQEQNIARAAIVLGIRLGRNP
jgi:hypothetical protein